MGKKNEEEVQTFTQSRMSDFLTCERLEYFKYRAGNGCGVKLASTESYFLEGELGHYALMHWYKNWETGGLMLRKNLIKRIQKMIDDQGEMEPDVYQTLQTKLSAIIGACHAYKSHYKSDLKKFKFLAIEETFEVEIAGVKWKGKLDLAVENTEDGTRGFIEHKYLSQFSAASYNVLPITLQQLIYCLGYKQITGEFPQWYMWNVILKSKLRRKGMNRKKDGTMPIPEPLIEFESRVQDQYIKEPEKMLVRPPPRLVEVSALNKVIEAMEYHVATHKAIVDEGGVPPMRFPSCTGRYGQACPFAPACVAEMAGHKQGYNAPECRGLYRAKEVQHEELV